MIAGLIGAAALVAVVVKAVALVRADSSHAADMSAALRRPVTWLVGTPIVVVFAVVGAAFVYVHVLEPAPPKALSFADLGMGPSASTTVPNASATSAETATTTVDTSTTAVARVLGTTVAAPRVIGEVDGNWAVGQGSTGRYDIKDTVFGMTTTVVGSTPDVSGAATIANASVTAAKVVVNMQTVTCNCQHDQKYHEMLETDKYPTSTFELTHPIQLSTIPPDGQVVNVPVTGNFTIHGVTHEVTFTLAAVRQSGRIAVNAKIPIKLADYNIDGGSNAAGSVHDPFIEFLVAFDRA